MRGPLTIQQVQEEIKKTYRFIEIYLARDLSEAGILLRTNINSWLDEAQPEWSYLTDLRNYALQYQAQLGDNISFHVAADYLVLKLNSIISDNLIGYTDIFKGFPNNNCLVKSPAQVLLAIKDKISLLNGEDLNFHNIALSIASSTCAQYNDELIKSLEMDLNAWGDDATIFKSSFSNLEGTTSASMVNNIYSLLNFSSAGQIDPLVDLAEAIKLHKSLNPEKEYSAIASDINVIMQGLTSSLYQDISVNIVNMVGGDEDIVHGLELFLSNQYSASYLAGSPVIKKIEGDNPYAIAASFYLSAYPNYSISKSIADAMSSFKNNNPTSEIVNRVQDAVISLSGTATINQVAQELLSAINSSNQDLLNQLTLSLNNVIYQKNIFPSDIIIKLQDSFGPTKDTNNAYDDPYLIAQALDNILSYGNGANIIDYAQLLFASSIDLYHLDNDIDYSIISSSLYNELNHQYLNSQSDFNSMAKSIAATIDQENNGYLVGLLEYEMTTLYKTIVNSSSILYPYAQASYIMQQMETRSDMLHDGASIAAIYYSQIDSYVNRNNGNSKGSELLIEAIESAISNSKTHDSITSLYGDMYIDSFGVTKYFNKCQNNNGNYAVTESIFNWNSESATGELKDYFGLNSITGMLSVFAQCGSWILTIENQDLLISTTKSIGTTGSREDTGCSLPLEPGMAMGLCESIFDATPH